MTGKATPLPKTPGVLPNASSKIVQLPSANPTADQVMSVLDATGVIITTQWVDQSEGITDHGALTGLADNDHPQYALAAGLSNLSDAATARTNLGLGTADSPTFAGITTGAIAHATAFNINVNGANVAQFQQFTNILKVPSVFTSSLIPRGPVYNDSGPLEIRNGTNGQRLRVTKTWTSETSFEQFEIDSNSADTGFHDLVALRGSAGGAARGIRIGGRQDGGSFVPWLSIDTAGTVSVTRLQGATASPAALSFSTAAVTVGFALGFSTSVGTSTNLFAYSGATGVLQLTSVGNAPMSRFCLGPAGSATAPAFKPYSGGLEIRAANDSASLSLSCSAITLSALPTSDPLVAGQVWRSGNDLKISTG